MKFKLTWSDGHSAKVTKVIAIQDGEEKQIAFETMQYSPKIIITEDKE